MSNEKFYLRHTRGEVLAADFFKGGPWYKLLYTNRRHYDVTYEEGLNVDPLPFYPKGECQPGGLYFTHFDYVAYWFGRLNYIMYIADVTVPTDARVYIEPCGTKLKADKLELSNIRPLREFLNTLDEATLEIMVTTAPTLLQYINKQNEAMCLAAVRYDGHLLWCVHKQTHAIQKAAMGQDPTRAFGWIK
jgi:hypothetical protein